jgi:aspartyl-tRNA(Asn)/glutamyl-tRNA(Gln) amidotransferase subunit A
MTLPLHELSVTAAGKALRAGETTSVALTRHALARIAAFDTALDSFIRVTAERALADAAAADRDLARGIDRGPMQGIPYGVKDIYATAGIATTCNSQRMVDNVPQADATVVKRLEAGGAVLIGKLNTHEFGLGGPGPDLPFPPARNPWNRACFTGGSSSGSGAAVAAGFVRIAMGSDTGGSIRSPACLCGVVGLKPTFGLVSRTGVFPLSYSLDHCGPLGKCVEDVAIAMNVIAGHDPTDVASVDRPIPDFTSGIGEHIEGIKVGYARSFFSDALELAPEVLDAMDQAAERLSRLGARVEAIALPGPDLFKACSRVIMLAEAYAIHEQPLNEAPDTFGRYAYQRILPAAALSAADLVQAHRLRRELTEEFNRTAFAHNDVLITACALAPAARLDQFPLDWPPPASFVAMQTPAFNVTGNPALALPIGFSEHGLPLGMQIVGRVFADATVLRVGAAFEAASNMSAHWPRLSTGDAP